MRVPRCQSGSAPPGRIDGGVTLGHRRVVNGPVDPRSVRAPTGYSLPSDRCPGATPRNSLNHASTILSTSPGVDATPTVTSWRVSAPGDVSTFVSRARNSVPRSSQTRTSSNALRSSSTVTVQLSRTELRPCPGAAHRVRTARRFSPAVVTQREEVTWKDERRTHRWGWTPGHPTDGSTRPSTVTAIRTSDVRGDHRGRRADAHLQRQRRAHPMHLHGQTMPSCWPATACQPAAAPGGVDSLDVADGDTDDIPCVAGNPGFWLDTATTCGTPSRASSSTWPTKASPRLSSSEHRPGTSRRSAGGRRGWSTRHPAVRFRRPLILPRHPHRRVRM
jgi:hypothetical protein